MEHERALGPDRPEGVVLPDEPEGRPAEESGTATVVLGAAAGTIAGAFLGPVGAVVGAVAGGALAGAMGSGLEDVGDLQTKEGSGQMQNEDRGRSLIGNLGRAMNNAMHEMGLDNGGIDGTINRVTDGSTLRENVKHGMNEIGKSETASIAVGGTAGAVVGSILGPVGTVVGAVAGGIMGDRMAEAQQHGGAPLGGAAAGGAPGSPRQAVDAAAQACATAKGQLIAQMNHVPTPEGRTVLQMAINALNLSEVELHTASGSL